MAIAAFLDRDGVVTKATHLVTKIEDIEIEKTVPEAIRIFNDIGVKVIIVTNQPQIARGMCTEEDVIRIHKKIKLDLLAKNAIIDDIYFCPHHPEHHEDVPEYAKKYRVECDCRKPKPGMMLEAAKKYNINLAKSFVIGDRTVDILAGKNASCVTILVKTGAAGLDGKHDAKADYECNTLLDAALLIKKLITPKAVILAGGRGERLWPLTKSIPKPMIEINGKPLLEHHINLLKRHGINEIIICASYLVDKIKEYFGNGSKFGVKIYYPEEKELLGTGGAIKNAAEYLKDTESFIVLSGDVVTNIDISSLIRFHNSHNGIATVVVRESDHPYDSDIIRLDKNNRVVEYIGRGQEDVKTANTGISILRSEIVSLIPNGVSNLEKDILFSIINKEKIYGYMSKDYIKDMGTHERLEKVRKEFALLS